MTSQLDRDEQLLCRILGKLESLAVQQYELKAPQLLTQDKKKLAADLLAASPDDQALLASPLAEPVQALLSAAAGADEKSTLLVQGLLLERLGQTIYKVLSGHPSVSAATRDLAKRGYETCVRVTEAAARRIKEVLGLGETLFDTFSEVTGAVLRRLDALSDGVDRIFGSRFGLTFSEVLGEFTAELLPACTALGMNRRKLVCHLTGVFMGQ
jgi:hypothetical protein